MIRAFPGGFTAACLFCAALLFGVGLVAVVAPRVRDAVRRMRKRKLESVALGVVLAALIYYGGAKQSGVDAGADDGIELAGVAVEYNSTNDYTSVWVYYTAGTVTVDTPVSVRNAASEQWRELVKQNAEITTDLSTNILSFTAWGNAATNRYWWVGTETPAVIIESEGITLTHVEATSHRMRFDWTCDDPRATTFQVQSRKAGGQWETRFTTPFLSATVTGFFVGEDREWRVIAEYEEAAP